MWLATHSRARAVLAVVDGLGAFEGFGPHYSRLTPGSGKVTGPGREVVLLHESGSAVWTVTLQLPPKGTQHVWRNSIFRNLGAGLSSELVAAATARTYEEWKKDYGALPAVALRTEIDTRRVRSTNPGCCYKLAGWRVVEGPPSAKVRRPYMVYLEAPAPPAWLQPLALA